MERFISVFGCFVLLGIAWLLSNNKRHINYRLIMWGILIQFVFALIILKTDVGQVVFDVARAGVNRLLSFTHEGSYFLFGDLYLSDSSIVEQLNRPDRPVTLRQMWDPNSSQFKNVGIIFELAAVRGEEAGAALKIYSNK